MTDAMAHTTSVPRSQPVTEDHQPVPAGLAADLAGDAADVASLERARAADLARLQHALANAPADLQCATELLGAIENSPEWRRCFDGRPVLVLGRIGAANTPAWKFPAYEAVGWKPGAFSSTDAFRDLRPTSDPGRPCAYHLGLSAEGLVLLPEYARCARDTGNAYLIATGAAPVLHAHGMSAARFVAMRDAALEHLAALDLDATSFAGRSDELSAFIRIQRAAGRLSVRWVNAPPSGRFRLRPRRLDPPA